MTVGPHLFTILKNSCLSFCLLLPHDSWDYLGFLIVAFPASIYLFQISNVKPYQKLTIKTLEWRPWLRFGIFIVNLEQISHIILGFLLLNLSKEVPAGLYVTTNQKIISKFRKNIKKNIVKKSRIMKKSRLGNYSIILFQTCLKYSIDRYHQGRSRSGKKSIAGSAQLKI